MTDIFIVSRMVEWMKIQLPFASSFIGHHQQYFVYIWSTLRKMNCATIAVYTRPWQMLPWSPFTIRRWIRLVEYNTNGCARDSSAQDTRTNSEIALRTLHTSEKQDKSSNPTKNAWVCDVTFRKCAHKCSNAYVFFFHGATQNSTTLWKKLRKSPFVSKERKKKLIKLFNASYEEKKNVLNMSQSRVETLKTSSQIPSEGDFVIRWPLLGYFGLFGILFFVTVW